jgi:hypothetical protein
MLRLSLACLLSLGVSVQVSAQGALIKRPSPARSSKAMLAVAIDPAENLAPASSKMEEVSQLLTDDYEPASRDEASLLDFYKAEVDHLGEADSAAAPLFEAARTVDAATILPAAPLGRRRYRTRLVRTGHWATRRESVESLTCTDTGPLVLALLPATSTTPAQVLAGPGYDQTVPLRPLELTQTAVLRLCGDRAPQVRAYAMRYNLHFEQTEEVARLLDYYNRLAVVQR